MIQYCCDDKGCRDCTPSKTKSAAALTVQDYRKLEAKVKELEGILATTQYRNSMLQAQVDNNNVKYDNLDQCIQDQTDKGSSESEAYNYCTRVVDKDKTSKQGCTKSASVIDNHIPTGMYMFGASLYGTNEELAFEQHKQQEQQRLKSASKKTYHWTDQFQEQEYEDYQSNRVVRYQ